MKAFLWFLMYQKGREEVAMSFLLKFGIKVCEIPNQGVEEERQKTPNPNILLMVSFRLGPLVVKVLQSEKAIYCIKTRTKNRCCIFHQPEEVEQSKCFGGHLHMV